MCTIETTLFLIALWVIPMGIIAVLLVIWDKILDVVEKRSGIDLMKTFRSWEDEPY